VNCLPFSDCAKLEVFGPEDGVGNETVEVFGGADRLHVAEDGTAIGEVYRKAGISEAAGHMKAESHLGRCYLKGTAGDAANAILTAVGHNFRLVLAWLRMLLCLILATLRGAIMARPASKLTS
jgi:hypothetical protein